MHLEYVPADELIYHNCKDYLEKDLKKHIKSPFLMHNPYEKDDEQQ
ncbi:10454_t:CDS:2 [Gigaspora rosea]|nr:10454_t:CDS:2 [Gigaspora rosea]